MLMKILASLFLVIKIRSVAGRSKIPGPHTPQHLDDSCRPITPPLALDAGHHNRNSSSIAQKPKLITAFKFRGEGILECVMRGESRAGDYLAPALHQASPATGGHYVAQLPVPSVLEAAVYTIKCAQSYSSEAATFYLNASARYTMDTYGFPYLGIPLPKTAGTNQTVCPEIRALSESASKETLLLKALKKVPLGGCPGVVIEVVGGVYLDADSTTYDVPPAVIRTTMNNTATLAAPFLPRCTYGDGFGRWVKTSRARNLVSNGHAIPNTVEKYWVPYNCRPTYWNADALKAVTAARGDTGCSKESRCDNRLVCAVSNLRAVIFTGASVASALFCNFREAILGEEHAAAARKKEREHALVSKNTNHFVTHLTGSNFAASKSTNLDFFLFAQTMPVLTNLSREDSAAACRGQIKELVEQLPSALVLNIGVHEICGAYGPTGVAPRVTRLELEHAYEDYGKALVEFGFENKTIFRTSLGSFRNARGTWWQGFLNCGAPSKAPHLPNYSGNPCYTLVSPFDRVARGEDDVHRGWSQSGVKIVDAGAPMYASPTIDQCVEIDGLHPQTESDEAMSINQLVMNMLCEMPNDQ
jgi:hypothetical protein